LDQFKYTAVSHHDLAYCNPLNANKVEEVLQLLELGPTSKVLDIGSGKAELLLRLIELYHVNAVGVDRSPYLMQAAREQAAKRVPVKQLELLEIDVADFQTPLGTFDLAACMGASEIFGGYSGTLQTLASYVKPNGYILVGEAYWKKEPSEEFLAKFGGNRDEFTTHAENIAVGEAQGLLPLYAIVSSEDDWDKYEWLHSRAVEIYAQQHPQDPDVPALLSRIRAWRKLYLEWGRDILGFGLYLFQK
jgi:SAM-dependent methyltransferase